MSRNKRECEFPVRGTPGGWHDPWDDVNDDAELRERARLVDQQADERAQRIGEQLRQEQDEVAA